jgi:hypothetical protein
MQNLLKIVTECIDSFSEQANVIRLAAIVGGEAVIMHGIPRTTIDVDILLFCGDEKKDIGNIGKVFASFLKQELGGKFEVKNFEASKDPSDPLKHDLIIITDPEKRFKKLDILIANYQWELEGLKSMDSPHTGPLYPYPKEYLVGMKLMAGGAQDDEDIRNLFLVMSDSEKKKALGIARLIRRDKNLTRVLSEGRRR